MHMINNKITVIGLGWLGTRVFNKAQGLNSSISGTWRSNEPTNTLNTYQFELGNKLPSEVTNSTHYLISIAPRLRNKTTIEQNKIVADHDHLFSQLPKDAKVIYTSSTSVYEPNDFVDEKSPTSGSIAEIEDIIRNKFENHLILRLGGLAGDDRQIVNHLAKKGMISSGKNNTNLIHVHDVVTSILYGFTHSISGTFNLCAKEHPLKETVYQLWAQQLLNTTLKSDGKLLKNKVVSAEKWLNRTKITQQYPNPLFFDFRT